MTDDQTTTDNRPTGATLTELLWQELADQNGEVRTDRMTSEWLSSIRSRVHAGELPPFIETDYKTGWEMYARANISARFIRHRQKMNGFQVRRFFPIMSEIYASRDWADSDDDNQEQAAIEHATARMKQHIKSAVLIHGSTLIVRGQLSFENVRSMGREQVDGGVTELREKFRPDEAAG